MEFKRFSYIDNKRPSNTQERIDRRPTPFAGLVIAGEEAMISASPERFLRLHPDGRVEPLDTLHANTPVAVTVSGLNAATPTSVGALLNYSLGRRVILRCQASDRPLPLGTGTFWEWLLESS